MTGCSDLKDKLQDTKIIISIGFDKEEVFRLDTLSCMKSEIYVYLADMQVEYEDAFTASFWTYMNENEETMGMRLIDNAVANISQIKAMHLLADKRGISLDKEEIQKASQAAATYYSSLNTNEIDVLMVNEDNLFEMYKEYALANKVYAYIIKDINPEISDDEARTIVVRNIFLKTYSLNGLGDQLKYSEDKKKETYNKIFELKKQLDAGEDFDMLSSEYSDNQKHSYSFARGETSFDYEEVAFSLAEGEISEIVETENGYFIIQCISSFDLEQTQRNKIKIIEEQKKEVFEKEYLNFVKGLPKNMNQECLDEIQLIPSEDLSEITFLEVYKEYFSLSW
jgi:foldase protein PrsA